MVKTFTNISPIKNNFAVSRLNPYTRYKIKMKAENVVGTSGYSKSYHITTLQAGKTCLLVSRITTCLGRS